MLGTVGLSNLSQSQIGLLQDALRDPEKVSDPASNSFFSMIEQ
jgi:hypothetical protein